MKYLAASVKTVWLVWAAQSRAGKGGSVARPLGPRRVFTVMSHHQHARHGRRWHGQVADQCRGCTPLCTLGAAICVCICHQPSAFPAHKARQAGPVTAWSCGAAVELHLYKRVRMSWEFTSEQWRLMKEFDHSDPNEAARTPFSSLNPTEVTITSPGSSTESGYTYIPPVAELNERRSREYDIMLNVNELTSLPMDEFNDLTGGKGTAKRNSKCVERSGKRKRTSWLLRNLERKTG